jgi:Na+/H+-dicarboxylate symporter
MKKPSLAAQVFIGVAAGVAVGLFFGEMVAWMKVAGDAFILLLQMTVLPYVTVSLIAGVGRLTYEEAGRMARSAGLVLLVLWGIVLAALLVMPLGFPDYVSASFFSTSLVEEPAPFDFLGLYIPANPFHSLANTIVPAVVVFSLALGLALIGVPRKELILEPLDVLGAALMRVTGFVARLAPVGVFAIAASAAGTLGGEALGRLQVYLVTYAVVALVLSFWVLPGLVTALTPLRYRDFVGPARDALMTAFATGNLLIVLPLLADESRKALEGESLRSEDAAEKVDVLVPVSFNFPNLGKLLSLSFVPFAAWFIGSSLSLTQYPKFLSSGMASFFGEVVVAMPFLLRLLDLPADLFQLFVTIDVFTGRFGTILAAMHTLVFAILGACAMSGLVRLSPRKLARFGLSSGALLLASVLGVRLLFSFVLDPTYRKAELVTQRPLLFEAAPARVLEEPSPLPEPSPGIASRLDWIRERGVLRVGYDPEGLPYSYVNAAGDLVGLDIDLVHTLAREARWTLELMPVSFHEASTSLEGGCCDLLIGGRLLIVDADRPVQFSDPYLSETLAFLVPDARREDFATPARLRRLDAPRIGIPRGASSFTPGLEELLPQATAVPMTRSDDAYLRDGLDGLDAILFAAERGSAWTLLYPAYSIAVPRPVVRLPLAIPVADGDPALTEYLNAWLSVRKEDRTIQRLYDYWVLGREEKPRKHRWSVIRDVLGWVE